MRTGLLTILLLSLPVSAQAEPRWPMGAEADAAARANDTRKELAALQAQLRRCQDSRPKADACTDILDVLVQVAEDRGDHALAVDYAEQQVAIAERVLGRGHPDYPLAYGNLGKNGCFVRGRALAAAEHIGFAARIEEQSGRGQTRALARYYADAGVCYGSLGQAAMGDNFLRIAIAILEKVAPGSPELAMAHVERGSLMSLFGERYLDAHAEFEAAAAILKASNRATTSQIIRALSERAINLVRAGERDHGGQILRNLVPLIERSSGQASPAYIKAHIDIGDLARMQSGMAAARSAYRKASEAVGARLVEQGDFNLRAQQELDRYRRLFRRQVATNWTLAGAVRP